MCHSENNNENNEQQVINPEAQSPEDLLQNEKLILIKDLKGWGKALIFIGVLSVILKTFLSDIWGVILVLLGIFTLFVIEPAMYIVLGVVVFMLGITNAITPSVGWSLFSLLQLVIGFYVFKNYFRFKAFYDSIEGKTFKFMVLSLVMLLVSVVCIAVPFVASFEIAVNIEKLSSLFVQVSMYTSILGTSFGLASVFCENTLKPVAIISMLLNIVVFVLYIGLFVFGLIAA